MRAEETNSINRLRKEIGLRQSRCGQAAAVKRCSEAAAAKPLFFPESVSAGFWLCTGITAGQKLHFSEAVVQIAAGMPRECRGKAMGNPRIGQPVSRLAPEAPPGAFSKN